MMWFYKLKRSVRVIIAVVAWLPVIVFSGIIGGDVGDDLQAWQAIVFLCYLPSALCLRSLRHLPASVKSKRQKTRNPPPHPNEQPIRRKQRPAPMYGNLQ